MSLYSDAVEAYRKRIDKHGEFELEGSNPHILEFEATAGSLVTIADQLIKLNRTLDFILEEMEEKGE